jgi:hypothetical protein
METTEEMEETEAVRERRWGAEAEGEGGESGDEAPVYKPCVHEEILARARDGRAPLPPGSEEETCMSTVFTDSMGGSYVCTRTGMVMGEGLITLAEREHAGALAEYGSDGEDECAEKKKKKFSVH